MTNQTEAPNLSALARTLLTELRQRFPAFGQCLPLAIGIDKLLLTEMPEISRKTLRVALNMHTNSSRYLKAMATATVPDMARLCSDRIRKLFEQPCRLVDETTTSPFRR